jgi:transcriptional regulator with XRE-family HTH domain
MSKFRNSNYLEKFGANLKAIRNNKKMTMKDVAYNEKGGNHPSMELNSYYRIEKGKVDISICTLLGLAKALDIHPSKLLKF